MNQDETWKGAAENCLKRLERAHDEADKYQVRALDAEKEVERLRAENAELRKSVATMACGHKDIGLPDCRICDPRAKPGAGT